jgi:acyl-CoA thioesterase II
MSSPLQTLLGALDAKPLGDDRFEARSIEYLRPRVFGGELLAQVLATAARTVQDRARHAIHVDFLFPGDPKIPIEYGVRRVRDGRRFVHPIVEIETDKVTVAPRLEAYLPPNAGATVIAT